MWFNRNAVRQGKVRQTAAMILQKARLLLDEFQLANFQPSKSVMHDRGQWTNPSPQWYKVNVDGAVFESQQASGVGVIIRDHGGMVAAALSKKVLCPLGPLEVEAKALEEAVDFAWDVGIRDAHFECDSKMIVDAVLDVSCPQASIYNTITGIGQKVQAFRSFQFSHVKRTGNQLAHILAQHAKNIDNYVTWIEENPAFVKSALTQDVLLLSSS
ncbi:hypothetical protein SO802_034259 [Lithocarpus litseifolius]|uniref:RNase H type-1 domain-containing protein n=1 Tax=Lithocarpus litseifolius TaxID=425828 RepID=A0AAW2BID5_9ROSI